MDTTPGWTGRQLPGGVVYELHIGTFTPEGTFDAAIGRLDHLVELGIDFVEVLPVNAFDGAAQLGLRRRRSGTRRTSPTAARTGCKRFVDACHARGLAVLLDVVYNHLGPSGAYLDEFGPYFAGATIWGDAVNLDGPQSDEVRRYVIDNALTWLRDFHIDGLRLDAVHALSDTPGDQPARGAGGRGGRAAAHLRRPLTLIAETDLNDPKLVTPREAGGYGLHAQWNDDLHHCCM